MYPAWMHRQNGQTAEGEDGGGQVGRGELVAADSQRVVEAPGHLPG